MCAGDKGPGPLLRLHGQGCHSLGRGGVHGHTFARFHTEHANYTQPLASLYF